MRILAIALLALIEFWFVSDMLDSEFTTQGVLFALAVAGAIYLLIRDLPINRRNNKVGFHSKSFSLLDEGNHVRITNPDVAMRKGSIEIRVENETRKEFVSGGGTSHTSGYVGPYGSYSSSTTSIPYFSGYLDKDTGSKIVQFNDVSPDWIYRTARLPRNCYVPTEQGTVANSCQRTLDKYDYAVFERWKKKNPQFFVEDRESLEKRISVAHKQIVFDFQKQIGKIDAHQVHLTRDLKAYIFMAAMEDRVYVYHANPHDLSSIYENAFLTREEAIARYDDSGTYPAFIIQNDNYIGLSSDMHNKLDYWKSIKRFT